MNPLRPRCSACSERTGVLKAVRWQGRSYCSRICLTPVRDAHLKVEHDLADPSRTVCRCPGAPRPLEEAGVHCASCRRMFSAGVRAMMRAASAPRRRRVERLRELLYTEIRLVPLH